MPTCVVTQGSVLDLAGQRNRSDAGVFDSGHTRFQKRRPAGLSLIAHIVEASLDLIDTAPEVAFCDRFVAHPGDDSAGRCGRKWYR